MDKQTPKKLSPKDLDGWLKEGLENPLMVDVREEQELAIAPFPAQVIHLPLSQASLWMKESPEELFSNQSVVVICHSGVRSWNFAMWLLEQEWGCEVWNLEGGIDAWSADIDPSVPRY